MGRTSARDRRALLLRGETPSIRPRNGRASALHIAANLCGKLTHRTKALLGAQPLHELHPELLPVEVPLEVEQVDLDGDLRAAEGGFHTDVRRPRAPRLGRLSMDAGPHG